MIFKVQPFAPSIFVLLTSLTSLAACSGDDDPGEREDPMDPDALCDGAVELLNTCSLGEALTKQECLGQVEDANDECRKASVATFECLRDENPGNQSECIAALFTCGVSETTSKCSD